MNRTYTIDLRENDKGGWDWRTYDQGGNRLLYMSVDPTLSIEGALGQAEMHLLIAHRRKED